MQEIYRTIARLTTADLTVMINGEIGHRQGASGSGAARLRETARRAPFVAINMAAIPERTH